MDPLATIVERLCAWKDVNRETRDGKDCFLVRGQVFAYLGKKGVVVKLAPPQVTEALKIIGAKRMPDDGDPHSREFVEIPVTGPREVVRAMMWLRRACRHLGHTHGAQPLDQPGHPEHLAALVVPQLAALVTAPAEEFSVLLCLFVGLDCFCFHIFKNSQGKFVI